MCKEPLKQAFCMFQGSRYLLSEQWEVHKGTQQRLCTCFLNAMGLPEVECRKGCPQIPDRFLSPTEQCLHPVIVRPDDPQMCPYVVCNNTISGQELYNVNIVALNSTAVRVRFSLSNILVGLIGHAELHFTTDPTLPPSQWHVQKFSRPNRLFDSPNIEYILNALRPNTTYFLQVKIIMDTLQRRPESEVFKLKMPEEVVVTTTTTTTTTTAPPVMILDAKLEAHVIDVKTVRISWRNFEPQEKKYIYALQLKYKLQNEAEDKWITTPMIHKDVTSYFLHDLEASADYVVDIIFTPPKDIPTKIVSSRDLEFRTMTKKKDDYHLQVSVEDNKIEADKSAFLFAGIPEPITKYVHVIKIMYKTADGEQSYSFKVPKNNHITLDHLKPGKKYLAQLELYLTNGQTLTSNEVEFITKPAKPQANISSSENTISDDSHTNGKQAELLQSKEGGEEENRAYFIALVVVAVVAAVAGFGFVLLLVLLVRRQASAKAPISRTPSESAYDNPTYKVINLFQTYDGERPEDKTNGQIQTTQA
ncbi:putative epidermal cell surface receptor, partial [Stegodyphus mimosarum]